MKKIFTITLFALLSLPAFGQLGNFSVQVVPGVPTGPCQSTQGAINLANSHWYICPSGAWVDVGPGAAGSAAWATLTAGTNANAGSFIASGNTWDFTAATFLLPHTAVTPGSYTNANITVGADGRVTAAANGSAGGGVPNPAANGVVECTGVNCSTSTTAAAPAGAFVGTTDTQTMTNKTIDGVTPAIMAFVDPTSSIQTQLNAKVPTSRTVNGHALSVNVTVSAADVGSPSLSSANSYSGGGTQDLSAVKLKPPTSTVASLPSAASSTNLVYEVTDGASATDCTTGSGSTRVWCSSNGTTWIAMAGSGGGTGTPGGSTDAFQYNAGSGNFGGVNSPTTNGNYLCGFNVTGSAAVIPGCNLAGVPVNTPATPYTMLYSDRGSYQRLTGGSTFTITLPQITGNTASNFPFVTQNGNSGNETLTANAVDKIDNSATGGSSTVFPNWAAFVYQDQSSAPGNWWTIKLPTFAAFPNCTDTTGNHLNFATASGTFTCGTSVPANVTLTIASGTSALGTSAISSASCATVVTTAATGTATSDVVSWGFNGDPTGVTGYTPVTTGALTIFAYPSANNVNFKVCNLTTASITPGAITLNWRVAR